MWQYLQSCQRSPCLLSSLFLGCSWTFSCQLSSEVLKAVSYPYESVSFCVVSFQDILAIPTGSWNAMLAGLWGLWAWLSGWAFGLFLAEHRIVNHGARVPWHFDTDPDPWTFTLFILFITLGTLTSVFKNNMSLRSKKNSGNHSLFNFFACGKGPDTDHKTIRIRNTACSCWLSRFFGCLDVPTLSNSIWYRTDSCHVDGCCLQRYICK